MASKCMLQLVLPLQLGTVSLSTVKGGTSMWTAHYMYAGSVSRERARRL